MEKPMAVVPTYVQDDAAYEMTERCFRKLCATTLGPDHVMLVDDGSPSRYQRKLHALATEVGANWHMEQENAGFSRTVNIGLRHARDTYERDAILVNADVEIDDPAWWTGFYVKREGWHVDPADVGAGVQGALLLFPTDPPLVQHAGVYFSVLRREFDHAHRYAPVDLNDLRLWRRSPVTGALMWISLDTLRDVGLFDEKFRLGWEDVDYCLRTFESGRSCYYNPSVWAYHHESVFRSKPSMRRTVWTMQSMDRLFKKHAGLDFSGYVPTMLGDDE